MECTICNNKFSTHASLLNHQKRAKYCLKLQGLNLSSIFKCQDCGKDYTSKENLNFHQKNCILYILRECSNKYEEKIKFLEEELKNKNNQIKDLQNKLENVAIKAVSRPTTTKNTQINYINQLQPLTDQHFTDNIQNLTIDHIIKGPEGYAQYALEYPLKDKMICVDYSRRKVKFKDKDGNVITDPEMANLATKFFNSIKDKNKELIIECSNKLKENFGDEIDTIVKIFDYKIAVDKGCDGEKSEFHHDFIRQMCSQTIKE